MSTSIGEVKELRRLLQMFSKARPANVTMITEHVRARLARQISDNSADQTGVIPILTAIFGYCPAYSLVGMSTCPLARRGIATGR